MLFSLLLFALSSLLVAWTSAASPSLVTKPPASRDLIFLSGFNQTGQTLYGSPFSATSATDFVEFGTAVAINADSGHRLAVGAPLLDYNTSNATTGNVNGGGVFFYEFDASNDRWNLTWLLHGETNEEVGRRLALSNDGSVIAVRRASTVEVYATALQPTLLVDPIVSTGEAVSLSSDGGLVAISEESFSGDLGRVLIVPLTNLSDITTIRGVAALARFGSATSFSENGRLAISSPYFANDARVRRGLVRVYQKSDGDNSWTRLGNNLVGSESLEEFGASLALSADGTTLVVGSPGSSSGGTLRGKATVYKYDASTEKWQPFGSFVPGKNDGERFGRAVAISHNGSRIVASSTFYDGHVRMLDYVGVDDEWKQIDSVQGSTTDGRFGYGLSMTKDGSRVAVGTIRGRDLNGNATGKVEVFDIFVYPDIFHSLSPAPSRHPIIEPSIYPSAPPSHGPSLVPTDAQSALTASPSISPSFVPSKSSLPSLAPSSPAPTPDFPRLKQLVSALQQTDSTDDINFGAAVDLASATRNRLAVGAPLMRFNSTDDDDEPQGAVFLYNLVGDTWEHLWTFQGKQREQLGNRLSLSADGTRLALCRETAVEIYDIPTNGTPILVHEPIPSIVNGDTVTLSHDGTLVAVSHESSDTGTFVGRVDIYSVESQRWSSVGSFVGNARVSRFGWATSFSRDGNRIAISAPNFIRDGDARVGLVKVFYYNGIDWLQLGQTLIGKEAGEQFGFSVKMSGDGNSLVVGSPGYSDDDDDLRGRISAFTLLPNSTAWVPLGNNITGEEHEDRFGRSVAIDEPGLRIAATSHFHNSQRGHVRLFDLESNGTKWNLLIEAEGAAESDRLGYGAQGLSMTDDGSRMAVGTLRSNGTYPGSVLTFDFVVPTSAPSIEPSVVPSVAPSTLTYGGVPAIEGCLCDSLGDCLGQAAAVGEITICLSIDALDVSFLAIDHLRIIPAHMDGAFFVPIAGGTAQIKGTQVNIQGPNCYIHLSLLEQYFVGEGTVAAEARGIALLRLEDGRRVLEEIGTARTLFDVPMAVEGVAAKTSGTGIFGLKPWAMFAFWVCVFTMMFGGIL